MTVNLRSWWQQIKKHRVPILVAIILIVAVVLIIVEVRVYGTGFLGKTLWDWLQLLIVPLVLAVAALFFQQANTRTERQIAKERYEQDQQIALEKQQGDLLQAYLDRMSDLLLKEKLLPSPSDEVRNVARVRTITVLTQLDSKRVGYVFSFLQEAGLMITQQDENVVNLHAANLRSVKWSQARLTKANLSAAILRSADLSGAWLTGANLHNANLRNANLSGAILNLANLTTAWLTGANLHNANLSDVCLWGADLREADLSGANLNGAIGVNIEELEKQALSLKGATMPDGSIHP